MRARRASARLPRSIVNLGLRLSGAARDIAALFALVDALPGAADAPWTVFTPEDPAEGYALQSLCLTDDLASALLARGLDLVRLTPHGVGLRVAPLRGDAPTRTWLDPACRAAPSLHEALRPNAIDGDPPAEEALLWLSRDGHGAQRTLARLMDLGRDDATVALLDAPSPALLIRLRRPPLYLLMRAREVPAEGVAAYARHRDTGLWVRWGWSHPLAEVASKSLQRKGLHALVDADGAWRYLDPDLATRSIYDVLAPSLDAARSEARAASEPARFRVPLRLEPGPVSDPELWLLDPEALLALEPLVASLSTDEARRFTLARLDGPRGAIYLLQELVRPNVSRLAARVVGAVNVTGYARAPGADNLYLPVGRRLMPPMRRDELRTLLGLAGRRAVILTEDGDGLGLLAVSSDEESPLTRWVDYVATDHRAELDRLAEESVFDWLPEVTVARPPQPAPPDAEEVAPPRPAAPRAAPREVAAPEVPRPEVPAHDDDRALREEAAARAQAIARGGCVDPEAWRALGRTLRALRERDDACACFEAAVFYGGLDPETTAELRALRAEEGDARTSDIERLSARDLGAGDAARIGAAVLDRCARDERGAEADALRDEAARRFMDPELPVSRRLAWSVLRAVLARRGDRLGLTRAKERVLGGINDRGLSEATDVPRFVRAALAALAGEAPDEARGRGDQLAALESLWSVARAMHVREGEPKGAYARAIFAVGFTRVGAASRARDVSEALERELGSYEPPNRALLRLYGARAAHVATGGDDAAWAREVDAALAALKDQARVRDRVEYLRKLSAWLRTPAATAAPATIRPALERALVVVEAEPSRGAAALAAVLDGAQFYDFEVASAIDRAVRAAMRAGDDDALAATLSLAAQRVGARVKGPRHLAAALGACIRGAAALGDRGLVEGLLDQVAALAEAPRSLYVADLLDAVAPALAALRRLGAGESARRLLDALASAAERGPPGALQLRAAVADGLLQLREDARARDEIDRCVALALAPSMDPIERFKAGRDVLAALRHFPLPARVGACRALLEGLDRFDDRFTASAQGLYETHKVLMLEQLVDAVVDDVTVASDRVRAFLDDEEQEVRRRILDDWRDACGR